MSASAHSAYSVSQAPEEDAYGVADGCAFDDMVSNAAVCCKLEGSPVWASSTSSPSSPCEAAELGLSGGVIVINGGCNDVCEVEHPSKMSVVLDADLASPSASVSLSLSSETPCSSINIQDAANSVGGGCVYSASNVPSPIIEEDREWMKSKNLEQDLGSEDVKPSSETLGHAPYHVASMGQDGPPEDAFMAQLGQMLQTDALESSHRSLPGVDDILPGFGTTDDLVLPPDDYTTSLENKSMDLPSEHFPYSEPCTEPCSSQGTVDFDQNEANENESVAELFAQWFKSNAHCFSLADLRKIKLKTSTIETATRRLGGGRKGLAQFLKFVLMWMQNCHMKRLGTAINPTLDGSCNVFSPASSDKVRVVPFIKLDGALVGDGAFKLESDVVHSVLTEKTGWNSMGGSDWKVRGCSGGDFTFQNPTKGNTLPINNAISLGTAFDQSRWQCQQGNAGVMCGGLRQGMPAHLNMSNPALSSPPRSILATANLGCASTPAATRAARKSRMERQRWSVRRHQHRNKVWASSLSPSLPLPPCTSVPHVSFPPSNVNSWCPDQSMENSHFKGNVMMLQSNACNISPSLVKPATVGPAQQQGRKGEGKLHLLFQKELKQSDVGSLGRIVLPKKAAETNLPPLDLRDGVHLVVEDMNSSKMWNMRYRFWPNNKSRMYLLENTGDFVKSYGLEEGDFMMFYCNSSTNKYMIKGAKQHDFGKVILHENLAKVSNTKKPPIQTGFGFSKKSRSVCSKSCTDIFASHESCSDDNLLAELIEQSLENVGGLPEVLDITPGGQNVQV